MKTLLLIMLPTLMSLTLHAANGFSQEVSGLSPMGTYTPCEPILTPMGEWK